MTARAVAQALYQGAETCDLAPDWRDEGELRSLLAGVYLSDPDDLTPQLVLADMLADCDDPREQWVRVGARLWAASAELSVEGDDWNLELAKKALEPICKSTTGWRVAGLWGCLVAWHAPSGDGSGRNMGRTWADERVRVVQRCLWFWALGFLKSEVFTDAAGRQAYAAGRQADAAWWQADAAWSQAYAAGRQADAARRQVWRFSRACWSLCESVIPELECNT